MSQDVFLSIYFVLFIFFFKFNSLEFKSGWIFDEISRPFSFIVRNKKLVVNWDDFEVRKNLLQG